MQGEYFPNMSLHRRQRLRRAQFGYHCQVSPNAVCAVGVRGPVLESSAWALAICGLRPFSLQGNAAGRGHGGSVGQKGFADAFQRPCTAGRFCAPGLALAACMCTAWLFSHFTSPEQSKHFYIKNK